MEKSMILQERTEDDVKKIISMQINPLFVYILERVHFQDRNFIWVICGETGGGKSMAALSSALDLQPDFNVTEQVVFTASEFINLINRDPPLPVGSVIIWDEAGVGLNNRAWFSAMNRIINDILQTYRHRNYITIFTVPLARFVDSKSRALFHALTKMEEINKSQKVSLGRFYFEKIDYVTGKPWRMYPRFRVEEGIKKMKFVEFALPPMPYVREYERKKNAFTSCLNKQAGVEVREITNPKPKKSNKLDYVGMVEEIKKDPTKFMGYKGTFTIGKIKSELDIGHRAANEVKKMVLDDINMRAELKRLNKGDVYGI